MGSPDRLVTITAPVHNVGWMDVSYTEVFFAYEATPENPLDDPNMIFIGDPVPLTDLAIGEVKEASVIWYTEGLDPIIYPVYVFTHNTEPPECYAHLTTTEYLVPVCLYKFIAVPKDNALELQWTTVTEIDNVGFHILRSDSYYDGFEIVTESMIPGAGTSYSKHEYTYTDKHLTNGSPYFYKLAMIDSTGNKDLSEIICGVPNPETQCSVRFETWSDQSVYSASQTLRLSYRITGDDKSCTLKLFTPIIINEVYVGDFIPPADVVFTPELEVSGEFFRYEWTGQEPTGEYLFLIILTNTSGNELKYMDINYFRFIGKQ